MAASAAANNIAGAPLPYTSKYIFSAQALPVDLANDTAIDTTIGLHGRPKYFDSDNQTRSSAAEGLHKLDARVQYGPTDERWHVAVVGKNLTNDEKPRQLVQPAVPDHRGRRGRILYLEETRNIAIEAGLRF